jgi:hypothetical protein
VTENNAAKQNRQSARRRMASEAWMLYLFAWIVSIVVFVLRPGPVPESKNPGILHFAESTLGTGFELFIFGYLLSRFFKQFKTGCAVVIILFFAYLVWAGRHSHPKTSSLLKRTCVVRSPGY